MSGQTQYACRPSSTCLWMRSTISLRRVSASTTVFTGVRPGGSSSMTETSRSAYAVIASVRGIGVAVMISWCGNLPPREPLSRSVSRWCTPKRCCSSTMTSPSRAKAIDSWNSACVPMTIWISPLAAASSALRRVRAGCEPVTSATGMPSGRNHRSKFFACCSASSSVGAISAACSPQPTARAAAAPATTVLPQPTSPCTSRTMGRSAREIAIDFGEHAPLRGGQRERQRFHEAAFERRRVREAFRRIRLDFLSQLAQRELVREQFFEREPALRGMAAAQQFIELRIARRSVQHRRAHRTATAA